jgi:hypothetical protein
MRTLFIEDPYDQQGTEGILVTHGVLEKSTR